MIASSQLPAEQTFSSAQVAELQAQIAALQSVVAVQNTLIQEQQALLATIHESCIVLDRGAMAIAAPRLAAMPSSARDAFTRLLADTGTDGCTTTAWTGVALGQALGLKRAVRERIIGPLEQAGLVMQVGAEGRKGRRYTLTVCTNNALAERINTHLMRCQSALSGLSHPSPIQPNALAERVNSPVLRCQSALPRSNALPERITRPLFVCRSTDPDPCEIQDQTNTTPWTWSAQRGISNAWAKMGLARDVKDALRKMDPERALALVHHAKSEPNVRNPGGLLRTMVAQGREPGQRHWEWARSVIASCADIPSPEDAAELKRLARPGCPLCEGKGWVETYNPAYPWEDCQCVGAEGEHAPLVESLVPVTLKGGI